MTRLTVELDEQMMGIVRSQAQENAQSLDEFVQAAIVAYVQSLSVLPGTASPAEERRARIRKEAAAWRSLPEEERRRHGDAFVAVRGGRVVDSDTDRVALLKRMRARYGGEPVLITPAAADTPREFSRMGLRRS